MNSKFLAFLGAIVVPIFVVFLAIWIQKKPDIVYLLSEQVPVVEESSNVQREVAQKLDVKNVGDSEAKRIVVKLRAELKRLHVQPFVASDKPETSTSPSSTEIIYPSLSPGASFSIVLRSGGGVSSSQIEVIHDSGGGREAFSKTSSSMPLWPVVLLAAAFMLYTLMFISDIRSSKRNSFVSWRFSESTPSDIWKLRRPWILAADEWDAVRFEIVKDRCAREFVRLGNVTASFSYRLLADQPPPTDISASYREKIEQVGLRKVVEFFKSEIQSSYSVEALERVMSVPFPAKLSHLDVDDVRSAANSAARRLWQSDSDNIAELVVLMKMKRPDYFSESDWGRHISRLHIRLFQLVQRDVVASEYPEKVLSPAVLEVLTDSERTIAERMIRNRKRTEDDQERLNEFLANFDRIESGKRLGSEKPDALTDADWAALARMEENLKTMDDTRVMQTELETKLGEANRAQAEVKGQAERLQRQLDAINAALVDPSNFDRMENLHILFAGGNVQNLKKIAQLLRSAS
jgi:hypothetical protein